MSPLSATGVFSTALCISLLTTVDNKEAIYTRPARAVSENILETDGGELPALYLQFIRPQKRVRQYYAGARPGQSPAGEPGRINYSETGSHMFATIAPFKAATAALNTTRTHVKLREYERQRESWGPETRASQTFVAQWVLLVALCYRPPLRGTT